MYRNRDTKWISTWIISCTEEFTLKGISRPAIGMTTSGHTYKDRSIEYSHSIPAGI